MYGIYENNAVIARFTAPLTVKSNQPSFVSDTLSLKRQISKRAVQRWEITAGVEPLSNTAQDLFVNLVTKGLSETVTVLMPQNYGAKLRKTSTSTPSATGAANATQLNTLSNVGIIPKGTFIKFDNHPKVYMLTSDTLNTDPLNIFPPLRVSVSNTPFKFGDDVLISCQYDTDTVTGMVYSDGILMDMGTITLVERL